jgi:galactokinase
LAEDAFAWLFGRPPDAEASAPGRVNLIGEHTDYNGGYVLPTAIPQQTTARVARRSDRRVRAWSADFADQGVLEYDLGREEPRRKWLDYVAGVTREAAKVAALPGGFDLALTSEVPVGAGLSSSAALEVSLLRVLRSVFSLALDDVTIAKIGQRAENDFVGAPVGIMDQMASSLADPATALFLDARSLAFDRVPIPRAAALVVIDSGIEHSHAGGEYRTRRSECEQAARALGVRQLRDVGPDELERIDRLPPVLARRARHVVTEDARVLEAVATLRAGDLERLGRLLDLSHESLSRDFEVSTPQIDRLVAIARRQPGVFGARLTGGGFGGSILALVREGAARDAADRTVREYGADGHPRARRILPA